MGQKVSKHLKTNWLLIWGLGSSFLFVERKFNSPFSDFVFCFLLHCEELFLNFILQVVTEFEGRVLAASMSVSVRWLEFDLGGMFFGD